MSDDFRHDPQTFVGVADPTLVFVGIASRADFDRIAAPCRDHGENENGHVLTKQVGDFGPSGVTVIFQFWVKSLTATAFVARRRAQKAEATPS